MPLDSSLTPPAAEALPREEHPPNENPKAANGATDILSTAATVEETEVLHASMKAGSVAQIVVAAVAVIGLVYILKLVIVTILFSMLLAFVLEPFVSQLVRLRIPRAIGALLAVSLLVGVAGGTTYFFYSRAVDFATQLPKYSGQISSRLEKLRMQTSQIEESTRSVIASPNAGSPPLPVEVQEAPGLTSLISAGSGTLGEVLLAISFIPFLVYFMITWKDHAHSTTVRLFPKEHRLVAHRTVGRISTMIRSFIAGNIFVGLISALISGSGVLVPRHSLFLFPRDDQRFCQPDSLPRDFPGPAATVGRRHRRDRRDWPRNHRAYRGGIAPCFHERSLS